MEEGGGGLILLHFHFWSLSHPNIVLPKYSATQRGPFAVKMDFVRQQYSMDDGCLQ